MPAYNNYYSTPYPPANYGYTMPQYVPAGTVSQYPAAMAQAPASPQSSIIWVTRDEAINYPVAPNNAVALWDRNEPVIYLKQADGTGKPTIKTYDLVERAQKAAESAATPQSKLPDYATKEELAAVLSFAKGCGGAIDEIKAELDKLNETMYGVAGKRRTAQKAKAEEVEGNG